MREEGEQGGGGLRALTSEENPWDPGVKKYDGERGRNSGESNNGYVTHIGETKTALLQCAAVMVTPRSDQ
jgi:hypothetical protein